MEEKLDEILKNQEYITKLLETVVEALPSQKPKKPDIRTMFAPMLESPAIKANPALVGMIESFMKQMEA